MTDSHDLHIEVQGNKITVAMAGARFRVSYRKLEREPGLTASDYMRDDQEEPLSRSEFLTRAWKAANDKARELGWII
jgi:hypothetical protein